LHPIEAFAPNFAPNFEGRVWSFEP